MHWSSIIKKIQRRIISQNKGSFKTLLSFMNYLDFLKSSHGFSGPVVPQFACFFFSWMTRFHSRIMNPTGCSWNLNCCEGGEDNWIGSFPVTSELGCGYPSFQVFFRIWVPGSCKGVVVVGGTDSNPSFWIAHWKLVKEVTNFKT